MASGWAAPMLGCYRTPGVLTPPTPTKHIRASGGRGAARACGLRSAPARASRAPVAGFPLSARAIRALVVGLALSSGANRVSAPGLSSSLCAGGAAEGTGKRCPPPSGTIAEGGGHPPAAIVGDASSLGDAAPLARSWLAVGCSLGESRSVALHAARMTKRGRPALRRSMAA